MSSKRYNNPLFILSFSELNKKKPNSLAFRPQANYTKWSSAAGRQT
jgi:hypothetical protein